MSCYCGKLPVRRIRRTTSIYQKIVQFRKWAHKQKEESEISLSGKILSKNDHNSQSPAPQ